MTSFATVDVLDVLLPFAGFTETGSMQAESTNSGDLVVQARAFSGRVERSWSWEVTFDTVVARDRLLDLHERSGYGVLPLRWTPPGESEISVFLTFPDGLPTRENPDLGHSFRIQLDEVL